ncbi:hypothetical protein KAI78_05440 [bacterium]|nr:hypothetical protein [bacterium]
MKSKLALLILIFIPVIVLGLDISLSGGPVFPLFGQQTYLDAGYELQGRIPFWQNDLLEFDIGISHASLTASNFEDITFTLTSFSPGLTYSPFKGFYYCLGTYARLSVISEVLKSDSGEMGKTFFGIHLGGFIRYYYTEKLNLSCDLGLFVTDGIYLLSLKFGIIVDI